MSVEQILLLAVTAVASYVIGCISFAYIIGKVALRRDIRKYGSKNAGATNMVRSFGWQYGVLTLLGDALKGVAACVIGQLLCSGWDITWLGADSGQLGAYVGALSAILGHNYPVFMKFKGGKGISTTAGVAFYLAPTCALIVLAIVIVVMLVTRRVSVGSITGVTLMFAASFFFYPTNYAYQIVIGVIAALCIFAHRENIKRLIKGEEKPLVIRKDAEKRREEHEPDGV